MANTKHKLARYWAEPPELEEVVRELDEDTRHAGRPTRSPTRPTWVADPYHFSSDARKWLEPGERTGLIEACKKVDPSRLGRIPVGAIGTVLAAVASESLAGRAERSLAREKATGSLGSFASGEETVSFASLVGLVAERYRVIRSPFGGKRCIVDRLPLPPCCANGYCVAHLERPTGAACGRAPDEDLKMSALNMVFLQHDADGSGVLEMEELPKILEEYGVDYDGERLPDLFNIYDLDRSGALDFEEFAALLKDMDADKAVAQSRMIAYSLPPSLLKEFSKEAVEEMRMTFGMFDESGDGALDEEELGSLLRTFGQEPTKEKIHQEMVRIDYDKSGTIEFQEFVLLMKKLRDGEVELDDSAFGRAVMNSVTASRLTQELTRLESNPIPCVESAKLVNPSPATLRARIDCPNGCPYDGRTLTLELVASEGYPFIAPAARFLERVFHLNFTVLLDGTTSMRPVLDQWTGAWDTAKLLREVVTLLREPDPRLLPEGLRRESPEYPPPQLLNSLLAEGAPKSQRLGEKSNPAGDVQESAGRGDNNTDDEGEHDGCESHVIGPEESKFSPRSGGDRPCVCRSAPPLLASGAGGGSGAGAAAADGEGGAGDDRSARETAARRTEARGGEGGDLREVRRSALVSATMAKLWYDDRPLYEQTVRRMTQGQRTHL